MRRAFAIAALIATLPFSAQAFTAENRLNVADIGGGVYEVVGRPGISGARQFWCAAGDYAFSLGVPTNTRVYLVSGRQPSVTEPGRTAVRFTLDPRAAGITPLTPQLVLTVKVPGDNLSVAVAREFCGVVVSRP
ncbi:hypothetical protein [Aestuariivita sp.]|jgi:hypothetical protein|uniref:hypothetical protein n=1 Tax=Aestuariivita sp. TaxID=1872407 RepID=UPI002171BBB0|nr:hypothetical protein [Aestuariivita sp.]MCE8009366.1 hypothetical protein [Aestuariivita sp.]